MCDKINGLDNVILPKFLGNGKKIVKYEVKKLTAPGENYGSLMLRVDVVFAGENGTEDILHTVAKMVPDNELVQKLFNTQVSFRKELEFYNTIVPVLEDFEKECKVENMLNFFPEFYGGRISLNHDAGVVDKNAVILLENLKVKGYQCADRNIGFNFEDASYLLNDLAVLHSVPLALKLRKPNDFKKIILPHLKSANPIGAFSKELMENMIKDIISVACQFEECLPYIECLESQFAKIYAINKSTGYAPREPFATFVHSDYWVNNTMVKLCHGRIVGNKMVDFQLTEYNSPAKDFLFFVFDSVQSDVARNNYDELLKTYHSKFIDTLHRYKVDITPFSLKNFTDEIEVTIREDVFLQIFCMLRPIFALKENGKDVENFNEEDFKAEIEAPWAHKEKMRFIIEEFAKRKWLLASD